MAAAAIMGESRTPSTGYSTPAAIGTPAALYANAKNRFCLMFFSVAFASFLARTNPMRSPRISVIPALSTATSAPVLIAIPTSAAASAGASLTPSPAIATCAPPACSSSTSAFLSCGKYPRAHLVNAKLVSDGLGGALVVTRRHNDGEPEFM